MTDIAWRPLDAEEVALLFAAGRTRTPTVLDAEVEKAYSESARRRPKASRKDYAAGYEDAWEEAMDWFEERIKRLKLRQAS